MQVNDVGTQQTPYYVKYFYTVSCAKKYTSKYKSIQLQYKQQIWLWYTVSNTRHTHNDIWVNHSNKPFQILWISCQLWSYKALKDFYDALLWNCVSHVLSDCLHALRISKSPLLATHAMIFFKNEQIPSVFATTTPSTSPFVTHTLGRTN